MSTLGENGGLHLANTQENTVFSANFSDFSQKQKNNHSFSLIENWLFRARLNSVESEIAVQRLPSLGRLIKKP